MLIDKQGDESESQNSASAENSDSINSILKTQQGTEIIKSYPEDLFRMQGSFVCVDENGNTTCVHDSFSRLTGYSSEELVGQNIHFILHRNSEACSNNSTEECPLYSALQTCEVGNIFTVNIWHKNRYPLRVECSYNPLINAGVYVGAVIWVNDLNLRQQTENSDRLEKQKVVNQNRVLEKIAQGEALETILDDVIYLIETQLPGSICSILRLQGTKLMHGSAPGLPPEYDDAINGLEIGPEVGSCGTAAYTRQPVIVTDIAKDPLWRGFATLALSHNLRACWSSPIFSKDLSVIGTFAVYYHEPHCPDEEEKMCIQQATHIAGIALEKHAWEEALRKSEERFMLAMDGARDGLWDWNLENGEIYLSPRYITLLGYTDSKAVPNLQAWQDHIHPKDLDSVLNVFHSYFNHTLDTCEIEYRMRHRDGTYRWILARGVALFDENDKPYRMAGSITDVTDKKLQENLLKETNLGLEEANRLLLVQKRDLELANSQLKALATYDGLTGMKNHRSFQERLKQEVDRALRSSADLSVILLDIDRFKQYNETNGHQKGDSLLIEVSKTLVNNSRDMDSVCRYGGEEFALILPETSASEAREIAERLRHLIKTMPDMNTSITASFGVSTLNHSIKNFGSIVLEADKALHRSKHHGRDCVTHFDDLAVDSLNETISIQSFNDLIQSNLVENSSNLINATEQICNSLLQTYDATVTSWSRLLDLRDKETEGHSTRVTELMVRLARYLGMDEEEVIFARWGALLHDIGKMAVPDYILHKPGPLTEEEWVLMRSHTSVAYDMLAPIQFLGAAIDVPYCHHEKWDGTGYPNGLKQVEIPLLARYFAVIDVYDALCSNRPYREGWPISKVKSYLREQSGSHFDPQAVDAFLRMLSEDVEEDYTTLAA